ncbi:MAG: serine/threonine-protein kinase [Parvularculaceae bacterium]
MTSSDDALEAAALALFEEALDQPSAGRREWILSLTEGDDALRARTLALYEADRRRDIVTGGALDALGDNEAAPETIGAYRIIRLLGRGGMGAVWLGERMSGDFDHRVAIKVVRGLAKTPRLAERLRIERQTLASLQHPNIAQLFDGGETAAGEPYFIMEYVDGAPLGDALETGLSRARRLELFRAVCEAVEYAHQKLIVHRDLSPSNILITAEDRVKLIDFGISRSFTSGGEDGPQPTPQMTMTRGYAAPERAEGAPATTLSDIYALGVILKDMLEAAPEIRDEDLSAIAAKASAQEPEARYQSVTALLADLRRHGEGRTVEARGNDGFYALGKFIKRRRLAVGAGALALIGLVAALAVTSSLYARAERERQEADARFQQVRELANYMLFDLYDSLQDVPGATKALSGIADKSREYLDALKASPRASNALKLETAIGYKRLGDVTGNPIGANLGRREEAGEHLQTAIDELEALLSASPGDIAVKRALAEALYSMSVYQFIAIDDNQATIAAASRSEALYREIVASGAGTLKDEMAAIESQSEKAKPYSWMSEGETGIEILKDAVAAATALAAAHPDDIQAQDLLAAVNVTLGEVMMQHFDNLDGGDYVAALAPMNAALETYRRQETDPETADAARRSLAITYLKRALIYYSIPDDEQTLSDLTTAETYARALVTRDPDDLGIKRALQTILEQKAEVLSQLGRYDEAIPLGEEIYAERVAMRDNEPDNPARAREVAHGGIMTGEAFAEAGRKEEACARFKESRANWDEVERRWSITDYDRDNGITLLTAHLANCG